MMTSNEKKLWYSETDGKKNGPFSSDEIRKLITDGPIHKETMVWKDGMKDWETIFNTELGRSTTPPPNPPEGLEKKIKSNKWAFNIAIGLFVYALISPSFVMGERMWQASGLLYLENGFFLIEAGGKYHGINFGDPLLGSSIISVIALFGATFGILEGGLQALRKFRN